MYGELECELRAGASWEKPLRVGEFASSSPTQNHPYLSWEMKLRKEESIPILDKCRALFKNHLLVAQDLWGPKTIRNSVRGQAGS